ncbi:hypothetical protein DF053_08665 [Burkholderia cepacia]|nr:hypothetical protein DF053_08665 [Burkholderia cepacia]
MEYPACRLNLCSHFVQICVNLRNKRLHFIGKLLFPKSRIIQGCLVSLILLLLSKFYSFATIFEQTVDIIHGAPSF